MSQLSQSKPGGNTKTPGNNYQKYRFFCTIPHDESIKPENLSLHLKEIGCKKFTFQLEKGDKEGYMHWQLEVSMKTKEYPQVFKNLLGYNEAHIECTKDYFAAKNYCSKAETRVLGPFTEKSVFIQTITNFYKWQEDLLKELLSPPDYFSRKIIWIYDNAGKLGKSEFCRYMLVHHKACVFNNAKTADIAFALPEDPRIILFDLPRSSESHFNYGVVEMLKNGMIFSSKYESNVKVFNKPHVVVFANCEPSYDELTGDKWDVRVF